MQTLNDIRTAFLGYFEGNDHEIVPSSPLVPHNDPTLMFVNAGMVQFKDVFSGKESRDNKRATSSQKCVRAGGKHNDLDNVGYTARHHTFFEMLGNFSFGDYFKEDAIVYGWEFVTKTLGIDEDKLSVTVYHTDDEAFDLWQKIAGLPDEKILRVPTKDNFWQMGDTGPCGPCSEIFYDHGVGEGRWELDGHGYDLFGECYVEIWNLVFMQFEKLSDGKQIDLPKPSIDTGAGLERLAAILQGKHNNYETDLFQSLISATKDLSSTDSEEHEASYRVIADHLRSTSFLIADGVLPSNEGRGYVLRRIMRRGMRHAHILGCKEPLIYKLVPELINLMGKQYSELGRAEALITETLKHEEERFKETLGKGLKLLDEESGNLSEGDKLDGKVAFKLYDTYGFPLDLTQDVLRTREIEVDEKTFDECMDEQRERARAAWKGSGATATEEVWYDIKEKEGATEFLGYEVDEATANIVAIVKDGQLVESAQKGDQLSIVTNQTPFYGESGGQTGDKGTIFTDDFEIEVTDTKKFLGAVHVHIGKVTKGSIDKNIAVQLKIDVVRRSALRANHSATHLLHAALRNTLGDHVTQKGSQVEAANFRFDFSHTKGLTSEEKEQVEQQVNKIIQQNDDVVTRLMTPDEAVEQGAMALFGEKYGDEVRVLSMGKNQDGSDYSVELCGGTHVKTTGEIEKFSITSEGSVASGVRRIEGVTRSNVDDFLKQKEEKTKQSDEKRKASEKAKAEASAGANKAREEFKKKLDDVEEVNGIKFLGHILDGVPGKELRNFVDDFKSGVDSGVVVVITGNDGKAGIVVGVTDDLIDKISAVDLVKVGAEALGGKGGGGRPDLAQAGGPDSSRASEAIEKIKQGI